MARQKESAREILAKYGLRVTAPRLAVVRILARAERPLSHSEVLQTLGEVDWDPATVYRNLVKLKKAGAASVVSRANGIDRYVLSTREADEHQHPHFECDDCGQLTCLPTSVTSPEGLAAAWASAVQQATVQLRGQCPDCV